MMAVAKNTAAFMPATTAKPDALAWLENAGRNALPATAPDWVAALRQTACESFAATGLPGAGQEGWQFTSLRGLDAQAYSHSAEVAAAKNLPASLLADSYRLVLINGQYNAQLSTLPQNARVVPILDVESIVPNAREYLLGLGEFSANPLKALTTAHLRDGFAFALERGQVLDKPLEVLFWGAAGQAAYPRILYWLGDNAQAVILERFAGEGASLTSAVTDVVLQRGARLTYHRLVEEGEKASHFSQTSVHALKDAHFEAYNAALGGALQRQGYEFKLLEKGVYSSLTGLYLKDGQQIQDFTVLAGHYDESGVSAQHFKGVVDDQARAVFQGKIHVHRSAQKTDGYQSHHALLLSQNCEANAKPELEIYADDVKCSHGNTSGQLDRDALFYLRSRGIPDHEARALMIRSFLSQGIEKIEDPEIRTLYAARVDAWLAARRPAKKAAA